MEARKAYLALAVVTGATLFIEIIVTRIFSVVLWYHFAFAAISLAMLGMAAGAMFVQLRREQFPPEQALHATGRLTGLFAWTLLGAYLLSLGICFKMSIHPAALASLALAIGLWAIPFVVSGMIVSVALTRSPFPVGKLYAADLAGAAVGCILVQPALAALGAPGCIGAAALVLLLAAHWLAGRPVSRRGWLRAAGPAAIALYTYICIINPWAFSPRWIKGEWEPRPSHLFWNAYSRIAVFPPVRGPLSEPGYGPKVEGKFGPIVSCMENIDACASTLITQSDGDVSKHRYLGYDVANLAYHLRPKGKVAAVGVGGGRDVLAALALGDHQVTGIELNQVFVRLLRNEYADFSGHLATDPRVRLVNAEARNWIERSGESFDVIQITFIDTWAATAAGAFTLSENSLYTAEAWRGMIQHLAPGGLLSLTRWYSTGSPAEAYRLSTLAEAALRSLGQPQPEKCVALVSKYLPGREAIGLGCVTILVSASPLSAQDCTAVRQVSEECGFKPLHTPDAPGDPYRLALSTPLSQQWQRSNDLDVSPPTDDRPFFFHMIRPRELLRPWHWRMLVQSAGQAQAANALAILVLGVLGLSLFAATAALTILPLHLSGSRGVWRRSDLVPAAYFAAIGLAFMLLEITVMSRVGIILGHPVYGLTVTLFSLLLGSGLGSLVAGTVLQRAPDRAHRLLVGTVVVTLAVVLSLGALASWLGAAPQPLRIAMVAALLLFMGVLMGMPFPIGLTYARRAGREELLPWLWGVNGACSVLGAFLATAGSIFVGTRLTGLIGVAVYALAAQTLWGFARNDRK